jgi:hypothetical protein
MKPDIVMGQEVLQLLCADSQHISLEHFSCYYSPCRLAPVLQYSEVGTNLSTTRLMQTPAVPLRSNFVYLSMQTGSLKPCAALSGAVDPAYQQGVAFLRKRVGLENAAVIARTLDVAMNPNSLFVSFRDKKRSKNANVRAPSNHLPSPSMLSLVVHPPLVVNFPGVQCAS